MRGSIRRDPVWTTIFLVCRAHLHPLKVHRKDVACRGRYFTGPDGRTYKWKVGFRYCWAISSHPHSLGASESSLMEPACVLLFLSAISTTNRNMPERILSSSTNEVSPSENPRIPQSHREEVAHMLDHIMMTNIYMESASRR